MKTIEAIKSTVLRVKIQSDSQQISHLKKAIEAKSK